ncbi:MAG TPA: hypothetical protein VHC67_01170 [Gaiellaceae bacterium]|nr:hypothetical protein [Gaiellaceae bacterium]
MRRHSKTWQLKKVLLSMLVVGGLSMFTIAGTFASLNSESSNAHGTIQSGTLTLGNKVGTASACFSYTAATNDNAGCDALFTSSTLQYPGGAAYTAHVTVSNTGSIAGSNLALYMPSCNGSGVTASPGAPSPGGGNPCAAGGLQLTIAETDSSFANPSCVFPNFGGACVVAANTLAFMATKKDTAHLYSLNEGLAVGQTRYYTISLQLPSTAANSLQGEEAVFDLTWLLSQ